jgi:hypothetical protein
MESLGPDVARRLRLANRWFVSAVHSGGGIDAFLKYWIALETLAMPDTTDVRPINELLARSYDVTPSEAAQRFGVGRLFGLRSRIVHDGQIVSVSGLLLGYIEAIFFDTLAAALQLAPEHRAAAVQTDPDWDFPRLLDGHYV